MGKLLPDMVDYGRECMVVFLLDSLDRIIYMDELYIGTHDNMSVSARDIVLLALHEKASKVVLVHNHPDGSIDPSPHDVYVTSLIDIALDIVDLELLEHYILGDINLNKTNWCTGIKDKHSDDMRQALKNIGLNIDVANLIETPLGGAI
tara:strand:+ start:404 stop:850 length:447 start_codon:yes stop_codon:yes gene_type:complete